jgi:hypothetical protein
MRYAIVTNARDRQQAEAYLPGNYRVEREWPPLCANGRGMDRCPTFLIVGDDSHGWTLDGYVIPRYLSGLIGCEEIEADDSRVPEPLPIVTDGARAFQDGDNGTEFAREEA